MQSSVAEVEAKVIERFHPRVEANFMVKLLVNGKAIFGYKRDQYDELLG